ncbi:hypothetical protein MD484_g4411, partial [Candolleomyces efflorescens]
MVRGLLLTSNLPQLQNLIKRDPVSYKEEFLQQWHHYNSIREIFAINPDEQAHHFAELVTFISQVATCYPKETALFPAQLSALLLESYNVLSMDTRKTIVQNLVMLRNKNVISSIDLMKTLFPLLPQTSSSTLRGFIRKTILNDIKTANLRTKNHKLNNAVQAMLFGMIERGLSAEVVGDKGKTKMLAASSDSRKHGDEAMWAIILSKELWRKGIWRDAKTVAIIAQGCFHPVIKAQSASLHFFLGDQEEEEDSDDEEQDIDVKSLQHKREVNKKTRSGDKKLRKQMKEAKKKSQQKNDDVSTNFSALQLLRDPQTFGEKLYDILHNHDKKFSLEHKILIMQLLSRIMGSHKLCVLGFYTYIVKYLFHKQLRIPSILVCLAQSVHDLTPPDAVTPVIRKLAQEFVHPGVANEVIAAGINSIREICRRQPWAMEEDLLSDLIEYRKSKDKQVVSASRGLLRLYREVNPGMLKKRERGKEATMSVSGGAQPLPYGHGPEAAVDIEGLSLLEDHFKVLENGKEEDDSDNEDDWKGWEVESDSSSDSESEGWIEVSDDENENLVISDSEDEGEDKPMAEAQVEKKISTLATTKILTPADFVLLNSLRTSATASTSTSKNKRKAEPDASTQTDEFISENDILGPRKKAKADYEERMASIRAGREGREKFGSQKGKQNKAAPSSSTNREKARNKPIMMIMNSSAVKGKKKASLRDKQRKLRAHITKSKQSHH